MFALCIEGWLLAIWFTVVLVCGVCFGFALISLVAYALFILIVVD